MAGRRTTTGYFEETCGLACFARRCWEANILAVRFYKTSVSALLPHQTNGGVERDQSLPAGLVAWKERVCNFALGAIYRNEESVLLGSGTTL